MKKWYLIFAVLMAVLLFDCITMRYKINSMQKTIVLYENVIARQDSIIIAKE